MALDLSSIDRSQLDPSQFDPSQMDATQVPGLLTSPDAPSSNIDQLLQSGLLTPTGIGAPPPAAVGGGAGPGTIPLQTSMIGGLSTGGAPEVSGAAVKPKMVDRIHDWLENKITGGNGTGGLADFVAKQNGGGLLGDSSGEATAPKTASVGPWDALRAGFESKVNEATLNALNLHQAQQAATENARILQVRRNMATLFPTQPNQSESDTKDQMQQMYEYLMQQGDLEGAKEMGMTARAIFAQPRTPAINPDWQEVKNVKGDPNGPNAGKPVTQILDKRTNQVIHEIPEVPAPKAVNPNAGALNTLREKIANDFETSTKPFATALQNYRSVQAATGNPSSTLSPTMALMGIARMVSPGSRTNVQALNTLKGMTGSFSDKVQRYINSGLKGTAEPGLLPEIQQAADNIMQSNVQDYNTTRNAHILRAQAGGVWDDNMKGILAPAPTFGAAAAAPASSGKTAADFKAKYNR